MNPHLVLFGRELIRGRQLIPAPVLDHVVRTISSGLGSESHRDRVPLLLGAEVLEDGGQAPLGVTGDLPQAVVVEMVADVRELRRGYDG